MRIGPVGRERPVVHTDLDTYHDLSRLTPDIDGAFLADDGIPRTRQALDRGELPSIDVTGVRLGPPITRPSAIVCVGMNYAAHAAESGAAPPTEPVIFYKAPNTVIGPRDDVLLPRGSVKTDWEVELAVVIGRRARYLDSPTDAAAVIAGYALANDVSERALQLECSGGQWSKGKSCESFNPLGPWLVPADDVPDVQNLRLRSWVNGEPRQDSSTADMIFAVDYLVWQLSQFTVLEPGDVVNTGTPEGVALSGRYPYLRAGDVVQLAIEELGEHRSLCRQA